MNQRGNLKGNLKKNIELHENESTIQQNMQYSARAMPRGKFIPLNAFIRKEEISQVNNLSSYPKKLEKEQNKLKMSRKKEIKIRTENSEIENRK